MMYKWFLGLSAEELPPATPPSAASGCAWGPKGFRDCSTRWWSKPGRKDWSAINFNIDATDIAATVDLFRLKKDHAQGSFSCSYTPDKPTPKPGGPGLGG